MLLVSGVGSFEGVLATAQDAGIIVTLKHQLDDHHAYTLDDIDFIYSLVLKQGLDGIVTTAKDWVKLAPLLKAHNKAFPVTWFVLRVSFSFLTSHDHESFVRLLRYNRQ
jgi:tetraacyldisaccharide-1-P 4'-kinase